MSVAGMMLAGLVIVVCQDATISSRGATLAVVVETPGRSDSPHPAVVLVHGSGRVTAEDMMRRAGRRLLAMGLAVQAYDKRGVGKSTGEYSGIGPANSVRMFDLLADDALAAVKALGRRKDIDSARIGLVGISQGGWIAPLAASRSRDVAFVVTISGPAVTVGEEIAYSDLAGDDPGSIQGLSDDEIERRMRDFHGRHGYDPLPVLARLDVPSLWILGERDRSIPLEKTLSNLADLRTRGRPISTHIVPSVNHSLRTADGRQPDFWRPIEQWLRERQILR